MGWAWLIFSWAVWHSGKLIPTDFLLYVFNNLWAVAYVIVLNFILFEYYRSFCIEEKKIHHLQYSSRDSAFMGLFNVLFLWLVCLEAARNTVTCLYALTTFKSLRSFAGKSNGV